MVGWDGPRKRNSIGSRPVLTVRHPNGSHIFPARLTTARQKARHCTTEAIVRPVAVSIPSRHPGATCYTENASKPPRVFRRPRHTYRKDAHDDESVAIRNPSQSATPFSRRVHAAHLPPCPLAAAGPSRHPSRTRRPVVPRQGMAMVPRRRPHLRLQLPPAHRRQHHGNVAERHLRSENHRPGTRLGRTGRIQQPPRVPSVPGLSFSTWSGRTIPPA
jgi:hypothetical protein